MHMYNTLAVKGGSHIRPVLFCADISASMQDTLLSLGITPLPLPPFSRLGESVARHPDMLLFELKDAFLIHSLYLKEHADFFEKSGARFIETSEPIGRDYPDDVLLNALGIGALLFGGRTVSEKIKAHYPRFVRIRQGYTRCSAALVGNGVITSDRSLHKALIAEGVDVLLIREGHIALKGFSHGFIGGASVTLSPQLTAFYGRLEDHPDFAAMTAFAKAHDATLLSLSSEKLTDLGGGFLFIPTAHSSH